MDINLISDVRRSLERIGIQTDFAKLTADQQLAYWFNLHNFAVIEQIALHYPLVYPDAVFADTSQLPLDEEKILNVKGVALSLADIRTKIVYPRWRSPLVIYGFFHGTVGGPKIPSKAFNGANIQAILVSSANEFINSLRGVRRVRGGVGVSYFYGEADAVFFGSLTGLRSHLNTFANPVVRKILAGRDLKIQKNRFNKVAGLLGGQGRANEFAGYTMPSGASFESDYRSTDHAFSRSSRISSDMNFLITALVHKRKVLERRGLGPQRIVIVGEDRFATEAELLEQDARQNSDAGKAVRP